MKVRLALSTAVPCVICVAIYAAFWCYHSDLRETWRESRDGKTYLAVVDDNGGYCGPLTVDGKLWPHPIGEAALVNPGRHKIRCGGEIEFDIHPGVVYRFLMAMEDYPRTLADLEARFSTEDACREYLFQLRWPDGFLCPRCSLDKAWRLRSGRWQCCGCGHQVSVTAGTVFQDTRTPLRVWFRAMWWITSQKNGVSVLGLQQVLGWGSYQTAWTCLHKLRRPMTRPGRDRLSGTIEVDDSYLGGLEAGSHGRGAERKALIAVAAEEDGRGTGRIRLRHLADASAASLTPFIKDSIEPGSLLHTDGWQGYASISKRGYRHRVSLIKRRSEKSSELLPRAHRVIALLKRWLLGTHQGAVGIGHLQEYLDEFAFRFNRRKSRSRGKLFYRLAQQAVVIAPTTYREIVDSNNSRNRPHHNPLGLPESTG